MSLFFTAILGENTTFIAKGAIATGMALFIVGVLNFISGRNFADMKLLPDSTTAGPLMQAGLALAKILLIITIATVMFIAIFWFGLK